MLQNPCFLIMPNPGLGHDWDTGSLNDSLDEVRVTHACNSTIGTNVGRHSLKCHHTGRTSIFRNVGLFGGNDVHDDAPFLHFGKSSLEQFSALAHLIQVNRHSNKTSTGQMLLNPRSELSRLPKWVNPLLQLRHQRIPSHCAQSILLDRLEHLCLQKWLQQGIRRCKPHSQCTRLGR